MVPSKGGKMARTGAQVGAQIGAQTGSRIGPVATGVASGLGGATGFLAGSVVDGVLDPPKKSLLPDGGTDPADTGEEDAVRIDVTGPDEK